jgi:O-antigen/teichoic acid export membrane protein
MTIEPDNLPALQNADLGGAPKDRDRAQGRWVHLQSIVGSTGFLAANALAGLLIARELGPVGRGEVSYAFLLMSIGSTVASFGIDHAATRVLSQGATASRTDVRRLAGLAFVTGLVAATAIIAVVSLLRSPSIVAPVFLGTLTFTVAQVAAPAAIACHRVKAVAWLRVVVGILYLAGVVAVFGAGGGIDLVLWAWVAVGVAFAAGFLLLALRAAAADVPPAPTRTRDLPAIGRAPWHSSLAQLITYRLDQIVVLGVTGAAALGHYSVAVFVMSSLWLIADGVGEVEYPAGFRRTPEHRYLRARRVAARVALGVGGFAVVAVALAPWGVPLVLGSSYDEVPLLMLLLLPGTVVHATGKIASAALTSGGHGALVRRAVLRTAMLVAVTTVPVVQLLGASGAAGLASVVYVVLAGQLWWLLHRVTVVAAPS